MVEGWKRRALGEISTTITSGSRGWGSYYSDQGNPFIRMANLSRAGIELDLSNLRYVCLPTNSSEGRRTELKQGDLLVSITAELGKIGYVRNPFPVSAYISQHICLVRIGDLEVEPEFVAYILSSSSENIRLNRLNDSGAKAALNLGTIANFKVPLPPLPEQRRIAEILRTWDEALHALTALRNAKARRLLSLTHSMVFGQRQLNRFGNTDGPTAYRWFALPASWGCEPIGKVATEVSERNGGGEQLEVLSCSKYDGFVRSLEYFKKQVYSSDLSGYKKIWRDDFGFPSNHVEEGSIGLQNLTDVGLVSPIYTIFRFDPERVDPDFAFAVLKTSLYRHIFNVSTSASVDRRGSLRWGEFSKIPFPLPPLTEQKAIAAALTTAKQELTLIDRQIAALSRQKRGLMQKLLTGEWRVRP